MTTEREKAAMDEEAVHATSTNDDRRHSDVDRPSATMTRHSVAVSSEDGRKGRDIAMEWYAMIHGAWCAMQAAAEGADLVAMLSELEEWDRTMVDGSGRYSSSDWPGWESIGLPKPSWWSNPRSAARPRPKPSKGPQKKTVLELLIDGPPPPAGQWVVYRHYDAAGYLLYVGKSGDFKARHSQHRSRALWWRDIVRITVQLAPNAEQARAIELVAISTEDPEWNQADRP